jgi:hypothetical protein
MKTPEYGASMREEFRKMKLMNEKWRMARFGKEGGQNGAKRDKDFQFFTLHSALTTFLRGIGTVFEP